MSQFNTNLRFPNFALALVTSGGTLITESAVCFELALLACDFPWCFMNVGIGDRDINAGSLSIECVALEKIMRRESN